MTYQTQRTQSPPLPESILLDRFGTGRSVRIGFRSTQDSRSWEGVVGSPITYHYTKRCPRPDNITVASVQAAQWGEFDPECTPFFLLINHVSYLLYTHKVPIY